MNALRLRTSPVAVGFDPGQDSCCVAFRVGCMARTPLDLPGEDSPTPGRRRRHRWTTRVTAWPERASGGGQRREHCRPGRSRRRKRNLCDRGKPRAVGRCCGWRRGQRPIHFASGRLPQREVAASAQAGRTTISSGGRTVTGGATSMSGGATAVKGGASGGGTTATGRTTATGGNSGRDAGVGKDGATAPGTPTITDSGLCDGIRGDHRLGRVCLILYRGSGSSIAVDLRLDILLRVWHGRQEQYLQLLGHCGIHCQPIQSGHERVFKSSGVLGQHSDCQLRQLRRIFAGISALRRQ